MFSLSVLLTHLLNLLNKSIELLIQFLAHSSFSFLLFQLIHIIHLLSCTFYVYVVCCIASLFIKLQICYLFGSNQYWTLEIEMDYYNKFIICTRLKEAVTHIREKDINRVTFCRKEAHSILMNFQITSSFFANNVWTDNQIFQNILFRLYGYEWLFFCIFISMRMTMSSLLILILLSIFFLLCYFSLFYHLFDLF